MKNKDTTGSTPARQLLKQRMTMLNDSARMLRQYGMRLLVDFNLKNAHVAFSTGSMLHRRLPLTFPTLKTHVSYLFTHDILEENLMVMTRLHMSGCVKRSKQRALVKEFTETR